MRQRRGQKPSSLHIMLCCPSLTPHPPCVSFAETKSSQDGWSSGVINAQRIHLSDTSISDCAHAQKRPLIGIQGQLFCILSSWSTIRDTVLLVFVTPLEVMTLFHLPQLIFNGSTILIFLVICSQVTICVIFPVVSD